MREYFRGWRRKAGCVTLVMALALMGIHARSFVVEYHVMIPVSRDVHYITICQGFVDWRAERGLRSPHDRIMWWSSGGSRRSPKPFRYMRFHASYVRWNGFDVGADDGAIPIWLPTLPLTLLSAYLLLWKPRKRTGANHA